jgi:hypothetical protein
VHKKLINRHDKTLGLWEEGGQGAEIARYGLLESHAAYCGTDLSTFRWNFLVLS